VFVHRNRHRRQDRPGGTQPPPAQVELDALVRLIAERIGRALELAELTSPRSNVRVDVQRLLSKVRISKTAPRHLLRVPLTGLVIKRWVAPILIATVVVIAALAWWRAGRSVDTADTAATVTVATRTFSTSVGAIGAIKPQIGAEVQVGSRISGRVARLGANIGDPVEKGQVIAELETAELDAVIAQRRAELKLAESRLAAFATLTPEEIAQAQANVASFAAAATLATEDDARQQLLLADGLVSKAIADAARDRRLAAEAQLEAARRALAVVSVGNAERRRQAEAEVERARAALDSALVDRSFTVLHAPISGVVASVATQEGETVAAGLSAPTFVTIVDLERLQVDAYVDEVDIGRVQPGQSAAFSVDAFPAHDFTGRVSAIYPTATIQDNVVKYIVALEITDDYVGLLRPEMTANVRIELESREVLAIPSRAIRQQDGRSVVYVIVNDRAEARPIRVGWRDGAWAEIVEGLDAGDRVLLDRPVRTEGL
jgi:multidrug efflux pump subunit AcrA (membrane-fusion protein)